MKAVTIAILKSALEMKRASIKRAMNTDKNPRFAPIYELELQETAEAEVVVNALIPDENVHPTEKK